MKQFLIWNNIHQIIHSKSTTSQKFGGSKFDQIQSQKKLLPFLITIIKITCFLLYILNVIIIINVDFFYFL